jgi:hypothetical protein
MNWSQSCCDRFWNKINNPGNTDDCWEWLTYKDKDGYGRFKINPKDQQQAHRIVYQYYNGPIPKGLFVCHWCDNPSCNNPNHLFLGTVQDNNQDRKNKGNYIGLKGDKCPAAVLTERKIWEMCNLINSGELKNLDDIVNKYNISKPHIRQILNGNGWENITKQFPINLKILRDKILNQQASFLSNEEKEEILKRRKTGEPYYSIAYNLKRGVETVRQVCINSGIF